MRHFDLDENGVLTFDEFLQAMPGNYEVIPDDEHRYGNNYDCKLIAIKF